jgi:hypothetical protein
MLTRSLTSGPTFRPNKPHLRNIVALMHSRTFYHVDEYREQGLSYLPAILSLNSTSVLWSPAPLLLQHAVTKNQSFIGPEQLLTLLRRGDVRIIGRQKWFDRNWRNQKNGWEFARWQHSFDDEVLSILKEDFSLPLTERRVIMSAEESGFEEAEALLNKDPALRSVLLTRFESGDLPLGVYEKARTARREGRSVEIQILRDAFNHQAAVNNAGAESATITDSHMIALVDIAGLSPRKSPGLSNQAEAADIREAMDLLRAVTTIGSFANLNRVLQSNGRRDLIALLCSSRAAGTLSDHIVAQVQDAIEIKPMLKRLFPSSDPIDLSLNIGSLIALIAPICAGIVPFAVAKLSYQVGKGWAQNNGILPFDVDENRNVAQLFQIAFGVKRPTKKKVNTLVEALRSIRS